jgi:hypothetical protein
MDTNVENFERCMEAPSDNALRGRSIASRSARVACLRKTRDGTDLSGSRIDRWVVDSLDSSSRVKYFPLQLIS